MTKPVRIRVKPISYQPSKAELDEPIRVDATPEALARAIMTPVQIVTTHDAKRPAAKPPKRRVTRGAGTGTTPKKPQRPTGPKLPPGPGQTEEFQSRLRQTGAK